MKYLHAIIMALLVFTIPCIADNQTGDTAADTLTLERFFTAAESGDLDTIKAGFEAHPAWIHSRESRWQVPPLNYAAWKGHNDVVRFLIDHGADVNAHDERWSWYPIHEAADNGHADTVRLLLDHGSELNVENHGGKTPLTMAVAGGYLDVVDVLIEYGAPIDGRDPHGWTLLHVAASRGQTDLAALLIQKGITTQVQSNAQRTALHWVASADTAQLLINHGADVNAVGENGRTPLHLAAFFGLSDVAETLIDHHAEINSRDSSGRTPLDLAMIESHTEVVDLLRKHGAAAVTKITQPATPTQTRIGPMGQFYLNDEPLIPIGVWQQPPRLFAYHRAIGANCMVYPPGGGLSPDSSTPDYVHAAENSDLGVFLHYKDSMVSLPGAWGWVGWADKLSYEMLRRKDANRVIICNFGGHSLIKHEYTEFYSEAFRYIDCIVPHVWPEMFDGEPRNLRNVARLVDAVRDLCKDRPRGEVSIWVDINPHRWHKGNYSYPAPTYEEFKYQVWLSLIHGADGVCIFPISFDPFVHSQIPAAMAKRMPELFSEVGYFTNVLASEESSLPIEMTGEISDAIIDFTTRQFEGKHYVFVINDPVQPQAITLKINDPENQWKLVDAVNHEILRQSEMNTHRAQFAELELRVWQIIGMNKK